MLLIILSIVLALFMFAGLTAQANVNKASKPVGRPADREQGQQTDERGGAGATRYGTEGAVDGTVGRNGVKPRWIVPSAGFRRSVEVEPAVLPGLGGRRGRGPFATEALSPWDDDLDVGMTREAYDRFLEVCRRHNHQTA